MSTLFFRSNAVNTHWDTWLFRNDGKFYLYYLSEINGRWGGFGVAESDDGVRWKDHGLALTSSEKMVDFLGTGSVWKSPDFDRDKTFIANFSEWQYVKEGDKRQRIFFAVSRDLVHWEKTDEVFDIDEKLYEPKGRWDCIYPIERSEGGYYGTWTATPKGREEKNGGIGFGYSEDGLHWHAMESNGIFPDADESGAIVKKDGKYYGMFGLFGTGMIGYKADAANGPYTRCAENTVMLPFESTYFSRFLQTEDELLVNHHAITRFRADSGFSHCYMAPLKKAEIFNESIHLKYWHGNDKVKSFGVVKERDFAADACHFIEGAIKDGDVISFGVESKTFIKYEKGMIEITSETDGDKVRSADIADKGYAAEGDASIIILHKDSVFEVYVNEVYMTSYSMPCHFDGQITLCGQTVWECEDF